MKRKELLILHQFRKNARENLTSAARKTGIPISTIYEHLRKYQGDVIRKHTAIVDFNKLGFSLKVLMAIKVAPERKKELLEFLQHHHRVNSLYTIASGFDIMVEGIFRDLYEYQCFCDSIESYPIQMRQEYFVLKDIKQEDFLSNASFLDMIEEAMPNLLDNDA